MTDQVFNIAKGAVAEKFRDAAANGILLLMEANEADATLVDYDDLAALFVPAGNTEASATGYVRKTGLTGTVTVDDSNERVDIDMPDQTWSSIGPGTALTKMITAYEDAAADATRVPGSHHDFVITPNGGDITANINASGVSRHS